VAVCVGRCLPGVRGYICIPAGVARMRFPLFMLWSTIGALAWSGLLVAAGWSLNVHYGQVERWIDPVTEIVWAGCAVLYLLRVATARRPA
jgi:membrane protein DedA with SNARE-associated domain